MATTVQDHLEQLNKSHLMGSDQNKPNQSVREVIGEIMRDLSVKIAQSASETEFTAGRRQ